MNHRLLADIAERALWTAVQAFLSVFTVTDLSTSRTAGIAAVAAVLSVIKSAAASRVQGTISPASFTKDL